MAEKHQEKPQIDIFSALRESSKKQKMAKREALLKSIGVKEFFEEGSIKIDMKTCKGIECQLCIKLCPTKALYWKAGEVAITYDICIYCTSCVLNCMVDDCIEVRRKRNDGAIERFSKPADVLALEKNTNTQKRIDRTTEMLADDEAYLKRYRKSHFVTEDATE